LGVAATSIVTPMATTLASIGPIKAHPTSPPLDPYWACKAISRDATDLYCITVSHDPRSFVADIAFAPDAHLTADAPFSAYSSPHRSTSKISRPRRGGSASSPTFGAIRWRHRAWWSP
jgi:hypothetical protein